MTSDIMRKPGWWYPWIFVGMFGVVVSVNGALAYFATSTFTGLQTEGAYEKGLAYNQTLASAEAQEKLGWTLAPHLDAAAIAGGGPLTVTVSGRDGKPVEKLEVVAKLVRPTVSGHDQVVELHEVDAGRYVSEVKLPFPGIWDMKVVATRGADRYQINQRVVLK